MQNLNQDDFQVEAYGTVTPPPGMAFCPECDAKGGPECPICKGTWVVPVEQEND